jgi:ATP-dependent RNA helicase DbpA
MPTDFKSLPLSESMLANLDRLGYATMTPIQAASLPITLAGRDLIAQAATGSGKTAAFALPLLATLDSSNRNTQALVLCPTRELADQVTQELRRLARAEDNIKILTLCGGIPMRPQRASLEHGAHIAVGTPGRIQDLLDVAALDLQDMKTLVLDEADRMLDMGFYDDIVKVVKQCPRDRQTLLFSATYPDGVEALARQFQRNPQTVKVEAQHSDTKIRQYFYEVDKDQRLPAVSLLLRHFRPTSTLAFCNTKAKCKDVLERVQADGFSALALHGELDQKDRDQVLIQFANKSCSVLVATDVAARGLDIQGLDAVINIDVTPEPELHIHRVGRTGRGDQSGLALNLVGMNEMHWINKIEDIQKRECEWHPLAELTSTSDAALVPPMTTLQMLGGRKEKIRAGDVLGALTGEGGLSKEQVGKINVNDFAIYVAVERSVAKKALAALNNGKVKGKTVKARVLTV